MYSRNELVELAKSWIGLKESDGSHVRIIDLYNSYKPLPRGYKIKYSDPWCAATVSALAIKLGYTDIIPVECSCGEMIKLLKAKNSWVENDAYVPFPGDLIFYDWEDSGVGDNTGAPDHVGVVEKVENNNITVIEGNKSNSVSRRTLKINGKYIRGFGVPKYDKIEQHLNLSNDEALTILNKARTKLSEYEASSWSKDAIVWALDAGLFHGDENGYRWKDVVTREELVVLFSRFLDIVEKKLNK